MARPKHDKFIEVTIHTAKCDTCNKRNKAILYRCTLCGNHICTPCRNSDVNNGVHTMNAGHRGRPRRWDRPSSPTLPAPQPISPNLRPSPETYQYSPSERFQSLPTPRRKTKRELVEESDDESDVYITENVRIEQRRQRRVNEDRANKRVRRTESIRPARLARAATKVKRHINQMCF